MSKICYVSKRFNRGHLNTINRANEILEQYASNGILITLRSLFYRFVANGWIENTLKSYKRLGAIVGDARLAGKIDWEHLEDRVRNLAKLQHFDGPQDALDKLKRWYHVDMWANQQWRPEVWVEKDALSGVISGICEANDVPYFCCRGYTSLSEMWRASLRLQRWVDNGQEPFIIHLGDHDPSGIDMSRDIYDRIHKTFMSSCEFKRIALNMDQIEEYQPPPNPAKITDSRAGVYIKRFGRESWELDALDPLVIRQLIADEIEAIKDKGQWQLDTEAKLTVKGQLTEIATDWESIDSNKTKLAEAQEQLNKATKRIAALNKQLKNGRKRKDK